jgi:hypothetical protein
MFSFPGRTTDDPPFIQLAKHILSVTANSASCERLFSVFGNTLTKLRSRLGTTTLSNLAELKMLVRDEHIRLGESQSRLKRKFGEMTDEASVVQLPQLAAPQFSSVQSEEEDIEEGIDSSLGQEDGGFASMATEMEQMLQQDEDLADLPALPGGSISVKIADLFDFTKDWGHSHIETAQQSLADESELLELAERGGMAEDGEGLDPITEAVLRGF